MLGFYLLPTVCCLILLLAEPAFSAPDGWATTYGGEKRDVANSIQQTVDGGYIVAGETESFGAGSGDLWVLKLGANGTVEWQKTYGGVEWDWADSVQQTSDGGYIVAGVTHSFSAGGRASWILKLRVDGSVEWQKTYGGSDWDEANSIQQTVDGGYIVAGVTSTFSTGGGNLWVSKLRQDGSINWQRSYGGVEWDWAHSIQQTSDGGYVTAGMTRSFGARGFDFDFWVLKLRPDGTVEWQKVYGGDFDDWAHSIQQTRDGGYIVAGMTTSFGAKGADVLVLKLGSDGTVEWQKIYGEGTAKSIRQTNDGGYIVAGRIVSFGTGTKEISDIWVLKLRPDGTVEWQKAYGGDFDDWAHSIQQTSDGGYIVAGETKSFGGGGEEMPDLLVLKLKPDGSIDPSCNFIRGTGITWKESTATVKTTRAEVKDNNANPQDSSATVRDTNVTAYFPCP